MTERPGDPVRVLFLTSNGAGMGHLTRLLAVALAAGDRISPTMLSMSAALPVVIEQGVPGEYFPGIDRGWMSAPRWHRYLRDRLVALAKEVAAQVLVFDGVAPYPGIGMARPHLPHVPFVWMRRGMWRGEGKEILLAKSDLFDLIIEPGDLAGAADRGLTSQRTDAVRVPPVTMLEVVRPEPRAQAGAALGLDPDRPTVLVSLGSGMLGDIAEPGRVVVTTLLEDPAWQIAVTRTAIAEHHVPIVDRERIVELHGVYPLVRYLGAFDATVSAAGYNAVHEFLPAGIPTLLVPNPATRTDDQFTRADYLAEAGLALSAHPDSATALAAGVRRLTQPGVRTALAARLGSLDDTERGGGAAAAADAIIGIAGRQSPTPPSAAERRIQTKVRWKERVKAALGSGGSDAVRRVLGHPPIEAPMSRLVVRIVDDVRSLPDGHTGETTLLMSDRIPPELIKAGPPVEHILPGASRGYRAERRRIVDTYFDVTNRR